MALINKLSFEFNIPKISFKSSAKASGLNINPQTDSFITKPINRIFTLSDLQLKEEVALNPRVKELLSSHKIPLRVNVNELENLRQGHLQNTRVATAKIYSALPYELKSQINLPNLQEAAMYHDYGKILIPENVLNKAGKLNEAEFEIMQLHPELSYELLKNKGFNSRTLNLIRYHHQLPDDSGYPKIASDYEFGLDSQILNVADRYSALLEKRPYKDALSKEDALNIIKEDVNSGLIIRPVYDALTMI